MAATDLVGRTAVVTGGSSGIGLAAARLMTEAGARVAIVGRDRARLDRAATGLGGEVVTIVADVSTAAGVGSMAEVVSEKLGSVDVLFANAGASNAPPL